MMQDSPYDLLGKITAPDASGELLRAAAAQALRAGVTVTLAEFRAMDIHWRVAFAAAHEIVQAERALFAALALRDPPAAYAVLDGGEFNLRSLLRAAAQEAKV